MNDDTYADHTKANLDQMVNDQSNLDYLMMRSQSSIWMNEPTIVETLNEVNQVAQYSITEESSRSV